MSSGSKTGPFGNTPKMGFSLERWCFDLLRSTLQQPGEVDAVMTAIPQAQSSEVSAGSLRYAGLVLPESESSDSSACVTQLMRADSQTSAGISNAWPHSGPDRRLGLYLQSISVRRA